MKNIYFLIFASLLFASCGPTTVIQSDGYESAPPARVADLSYQSFYDQLSPYGNWISYPEYGYVWMPNAGPDFRPYASNGNWLYTDAGWTWASNYSWGWAPFHYGRWFYENGYGWLWVPGNQWAPAWVSWRGGSDYYGWAPLGPRVSLDIALNNYNPPVNYWNFVPRQYMGNPEWHQYYANEGRNITIINNTTIINNYSGTNPGRYAYAPGPDPNEVRQVSGNNFAAVHIREANSPGERMNGSQYMIYHPSVNNTPASRGDAAGRPATQAPARYESFNNLRPTMQKPFNANSQPPVNNSRPAERQNTGYSPSTPNNQPAYRSQPANDPQPPANNSRPAERPNTGYSPSAPNNQPAYRSQPANNPQPPVNNYRPAERQNTGFSPSTPNNQPVQNPPANNHPQAMRANEFSHPPLPVQPAQPANMPQVSPPNRVQTTGRPTSVQGSNNSRLVPQTPRMETRPEQKPMERPKTRQANNN